MSLAQRLALLKGNRNPSPNADVRTGTGGASPTPTRLRQPRRYRGRHQQWFRWLPA